MTDPSSVRVDSRISIPLAELTFKATRAGGPGGQHVNKVSSRVTLYFDLDGSPSLDEAQKRRVRRVLGQRVGRDGRLRVASQKHRSQAANRREALQRFAALLRQALRRRRPRVATRVSDAEQRRRLEDKRRRARLKRHRARPRDDD